MNNLCKALAGLLTAVAITSPASAAYIIIDDSDIDNITFTAGDFENGFSINGNELTSGIGNSGSITLPDAGYDIFGSWIDLGMASGQFVDLLFTVSGFPNDVLSGLSLSATTDGQNGTIDGSVGAYTGFPYFVTGLNSYAQNGQTVVGSLPFLSISFTSEAPEPASMALLGLGIAGLGLARRRKTAA